MRAFVRPVSLGVAAVAVLASALSTRAQAPPAGQPTAPAQAKAVAPARPANWNQALATVNGKTITRGKLLDFLSRYQLPPDDDRSIIYRDAMETLVNMELIAQYLERLNLPVSEDRLDKAIADLEQQLKADGTSLQRELLENDKTLAEVRQEYANRIRWIDYVKKRGTDAELKKFADAHKDYLNGSQVRASHILLRVDPKATPAVKEKIRQKLLSIKQELKDKKLTFAQAANKHSEDTGNVKDAGGDIGYFPLSGGIVEEFGKAAFALKPGEVSDPVETPYGYHLILVTDRKEGQKVDLEQQKVLILNQFASELQKELLIAQRKIAKIDIKPMPADLFPPMTPAADAAAQPKAAAKPKAAQPK